MVLKASELPDPFGQGATWHVQDEWGNKHKMKRMPSEIYIQKGSKPPKLHLVFEVIEKSKTKRVNPF